MHNKSTKAPSLTLVPSGGLANRMRAVASALQLCRSVSGRLTVVWFRDWTLNARFYDIFEPISPDTLDLRDATLADHLLLDRPRRHNLWLPALPLRMRFSHRIHEYDVYRLKRDGFDFERWARQGRCYMSCYNEFGDLADDTLRELFRPAAAVAKAVERYRQLLGPAAIGMHIRRTDHSEAIASSPTSLFVEAARREIKANPAVKIYLATDDEGVKSEMREALGQRLITPDAPASRGDTEGIRAGLTDMFTLAATKRIYGSAGSSFSTMAARLGAVPIEILTQ